MYLIFTCIYYLLNFVVMTSATVCIVPCTSYTYYNIMYHNNYDVSERRAHTHTAYTDIHIHTTRPHYEFSIVFLYYNMSCCHEICLCVRMQTSVCVCVCVSIYMYAWININLGCFS